MEKWEVVWITKNGVDLQRNTRCTIPLLNALEAKGILDSDEVTELYDEPSTAAKVNKFYKILMTRKCYDILTDELGNCKQTGAEQILRDGKAEHERPMKAESRNKDEEMKWCGPPHEKRFLQGPNGLQDFLTSKPHKVLLMSTMDVDVTISKIRDNLKMPLVVTENKRHLRELLLEYSSESSNLFVFRCVEPPDSDFLAKVVTWGPKETKAIILTKDHSLSETENSTALQTSRDNLRWTDLKFRFQEELLAKQVRNQIGWEPRKVREILKEALAEEELEDEKLILSLIKNEGPALFRPLPAAVSYYVQRKIRSRFVLRKDSIFNKKTSDIFVFTGIDIGDLSRYLSRCRHSSDNSWSQVSQLSVNYILLEHTDHFDKICEKAKKGKSVHWIHHDNGKFLWAKSGNGSMKRIQEAAEGSTEENLPFSESEFIRHLEARAGKYGNSPVLICDTPGMGKSTLLQNLARRILGIYSGTKIVLFVAFSDLINVVKAHLKNPLEIPHEIFEQTLSQLTAECGPELGKCVLKGMLLESSKIRAEVKVELMLDGYDEINSDDLPLANELLTLIQNSYHSTKIWVATRPHRMHELEDELHVVGYTILPFEETDQKNFLTKFWQSERIKEEASPNCPNIDHDLTKFAKHCLKTVKHIWAKNTEKEDICGVPLQCMLIAMVYLDDCLSFTNRDKLTTNSEPRLSLKVTSIKDLYEALIEKKLQIYTGRYAKQFRPEMKTRLINYHYFFALQLLFPKYAPCFESALTFDSFPMTDIFNLGIVEASAVELKGNQQIRFGHRTIPEFLVARFVAEQLYEDEGDPGYGEKVRMTNHTHEATYSSIRFTNYDIGNLLFDGVLRTLEFDLLILQGRFDCETFENQALVFFLDSLLQGRPLDKSTRLGGIVAGRYRPVTACIFGDHLHLFKALRNGFEKMDSAILVAAVTKASKLFLEYICNEYNVNLVDENEIFASHDDTLLHLAAGCREFSIVEFLLNCQGFDKLVKDDQPSIQNLLRTVVDDSIVNPEWLIKEKIQLMRKLVELNKNLLEAEKSSCIFNMFVHAELIIGLLDLGLNPLLKSWRDATLLHRCSTSFSGDDFHRVLTRLTDEQVKSLVNAKITEEGASVLHSIASNKRPPKKEALEHLLKLGANFAIVNAKGQTCLHIAAAVGNVEAARLFLELGMHAVVNVKDSRGRTPLDHLLLYKYVNTEHLEEFGELLISYGATFSTAIIAQSIHKPMSRGNASLVPVRFALKHIYRGDDVNKRDSNLNTPLHTCMKVAYPDSTFEIVKMLLEKGAEVNAENNNGETPLQLQTCRNSFVIDLRSVSVLLSKGGLVGSIQGAQNAFLKLLYSKTSLPYEDFEASATSLMKQGAELRTDWEHGGNEILFECIRHNSFNGVKYLLENGVSVNGHQEDMPPLHASLCFCIPFAGTTIVEHLLEKGANVNTLDSRGLPPLERWIKTSSKPNLELLLFFHGKFEQVTTPLTTVSATSLLFQVAKYGEGSLGELKLLPIAQSKLLAAADVREVDDDGNSLLHYAAKQRRAHLVKFFLQKGAAVNLRNSEGNTPLRSVFNEEPILDEADQVVATIKAILWSNAADVRDVDAEGTTLLDISLRYDSPLVVKYILETGRFDEIIRSKEFLWRKVFSVERIDYLQQLFSRFVQSSGGRLLQDVGRDSSDPVKRSVLHAAVAVGNNDLVEFLLDEKMFVLSPLSEMELVLRFANLIHLGVRNTKQLSRPELVQRMNIIVKLAHENKDLLNSKDAWGRTPRLVEDVHESLLQALVELGATSTPSFGIENPLPNYSQQSQPTISKSYNPIRKPKKREYRIGYEKMGDPMRIDDEDECKIV